MTLKLGRKPRLYLPHVPHMSALLSLARGAALLPISDYAHWADPLPADVGMMLNDEIGCCTAAAVYHARQVWRRYADGVLETASDDVVSKFYQRFGWDGVVGDPSDQGAEEQPVLQNWVQAGIQVAGGYDHLVVPIEVDPRNPEDLCRAIYECGIVYVGINIPQGFMGSVPTVWDASPAYGAVEGGHAVVFTGYDRNAGAFDLISWGRHDYKMTRAFWASYGEEAYALVDAGWVAATGRTPLGMTLDALAAQAAALRAA